MIIRYGIANVTPEEVARAGQEYWLSGSVTSGYGFGKWGVEPTTFLEFSTGDSYATDTFVMNLLKSHGENSAYRVLDNVATLLHSTGEITSI